MAWQLAAEKVHGSSTGREVFFSIKKIRRKKRGVMNDPLLLRIRGQKRDGGFRKGGKVRDL